MFLGIRTEPHKDRFSTKGSWQRNDLMDLGVTVCWPRLNLGGSDPESETGQVEAVPRFLVFFSQ